MSEFIYNVKEEDQGLQIKELLRREFKFSGRLRTRLKQNDCIYVNGQSVRGWMPAEAGDIIEVRFPEECSDFEPEHIPIDVVFEDADMLIINKQPGFVVHPTKGKPCHTMANGIMQYILDTNQHFKIRFVNRLDMNTSGLLIVAKNSHVQEKLIQQMKSNIIKKKYVAIVKGVIPDDHGTIDAPIGRPDPEQVERGVVEGGRPSVTHYTVLERFSKGYTIVELLLETGRTHQIRVHMSYIGYPIAGDHLYGQECPWLIERHALHARALILNHPITGEHMELVAPLPDDMEQMIKKLRCSDIA